MSQNEIPTKSSCFNTDEEAQAGVLDSPNNTLLAKAAFPRDQIEFNFMMSLSIRFLDSEKYRKYKLLLFTPQPQPFYCIYPTDDAN